MATVVSQNMRRTEALHHGRRSPGAIIALFGALLMASLPTLSTLASVYPYGNLPLFCEAHAGWSNENAIATMSPETVIRLTEAESVPLAGAIDCIVRSSDGNSVAESRVWTMPPVLITSTYVGAMLACVASCGLWRRARRDG